jgi:integrase
MRKYARDWIEKFPSIAKINVAIAGPRRLGSEKSVENYIKAVRKFLAFLNIREPETALKKFQMQELNAGKKVDEFIDDMLEKYAHQTVRGFLFGIKKWLSLNGVTVDWKKIEFPTSAEIKEIDRAPTKEEIKILLRHTRNARDKAVTLLLASSGLRIGTLLSLQVRDVDLHSYPDVGRIMVVRKRGRKFVGKRRGSQGRVYFTFCTPEAKKALIEYFKTRKRAGEELNKDSPLIGDAYNKGKRISVESYEKVWHRLLKRSGLDQKSENWYKLHLHTLRKYFRSNAVGVDPSYRESWMGHKSGYLDESYFRAEEQQHLAEYRKVITHLSIYEAPSEEKRKLRSRMLLDFARLQGYNEAEIKRFRDVLARSKDIDEAIIEFRRFKDYPKTITHDKDKGEFFVVNNEAELIQKLQDGWELVRPLNGSKFLIQHS